MNEQLKRRLVGGIAFLLGVAVLISFLFHRAEPLEELSGIPPAPEFTRMEIKALEPPPGLERIERKLAEVKRERLRETDRRKERVPQEDEAESDIRDALDQMVFDERGVPKRWAVQAASYRSLRNAERFKAQLADEGLPVMMRNVSLADENVFYVVYVGPVLRQSKAWEYKHKVDKEYDTETIIREWN